MIYGMYCMRDIKTGYMQPNVDLNDASAVRNFEHAVMNKDSLLYTHASDYELYKIGTFDTNTGTLVPIMPECICTANDVKELI